MNIVTKKAIKNLEFIYKPIGIKAMENPTFKELINDPYFYEKHSNNGLKFLVTMQILGVNQLTLGHLRHDYDNYIGIVKEGLKNFDYELFRNTNTMQITFDENDVNAAIKDLQKLLTKSFIHRENV